MSLLSDLPDDILNLISIRLNGFDNCSLWMASDSILRQRLFNGVITDFDIKYTIPGRYLWPGNFLKKLKHFCCINLLLTDLAVPNTLFSNNLTTLKLTKTFGIGPQFISALPQSLTDLVLSGTSREAQQQSAFFSLLPRKLKSLATDLSVVDNLSLLPESLRSLELTSPTLCDASYFDRLPPKLEILIITAPIPLSILEQLPASLTDLYVSCNQLVDDRVVRMLPRGLKQFSLKSLDNITDAGAAELPPSLKRLTLCCNIAITDDAISLLPRNLMSLNLPRNPNLTDQCIKHLPPTLTTLYLDATTKITSKSCKDLPRYLETLSLPKCPDWDPELMIASKTELPQFLRNIDLRWQDPQALRTWKNIIKDLEVPYNPCYSD